MAWLFVFGMLIGSILFGIVFKVYIAYGEAELHKLAEMVEASRATNASLDNERVMARLLAVPRIVVCRNRSLYDAIWNYLWQAEPKDD